MREKMKQLLRGVDYILEPFLSIGSEPDQPLSDVPFSTTPCNHKRIHTGGDDRLGYFTCLDCKQQVLICSLLDKMLERIRILERGESKEKDLGPGANSNV